MRPLNINSESSGLDSISWEGASYNGPTSFVVARDARLDYLPGNIVHVPGAARPYASVILAVYSSPNTTVYLSDESCFSGMASVGLASSRRSLCSPANGTASMATGIFSGTAAAAFLFQVDGASQCLSSQTDAGVSGVSRIVFQFNSAKSIRWMNLLQIYPGAVPAVKMQYSDNGSSWTDHATFSDLIPGASNLAQFRISPPPAAAHVYWGILANAAPTSGYWRLNSLAMGE